jgi:hypothetical protein
MTWTPANIPGIRVRKSTADGLYGPRPTPIDDEVREEYGTLMHKQPGQKCRETRSQTFLER